jgi:hypothetical protein
VGVEDPRRRRFIPPRPTNHLEAQTHPVTIAKRVYAGEPSIISCASLMPNVKKI